MTSMAEIFARLADREADDNVKPPAVPLIEAQLHAIATILDRSAASVADQANTPFHRGDRVQFIPATGDFKHGLAEQLALVFWRWIDPSDQFDQRLLSELSENEIKQLDRVDCIIGLINVDGRFCFSPTNSALLERWNEPTA